jgi:dipeptidyl aminopeptidase/acylaminoacyl peptidase
MESASHSKDAKEGRDQVVVGAELKARRLWILDVATQRTTRVTNDESHVLGFDWSPDGSALALRTSETPLVDDDYMYSSLSMVPAAGGIPAPLVQTQGKLGAPVFSPSGSHVAWLGATDLNDPYAGSVFVAPVTGGAPLEVTRGHEGVATAVEWKDDGTLVVAATRGTETVLELVPRRGGAARVVVSGGPVFTDFVLSPAGKHVALIGNTPTCPNEVYAAPLGGGATRLRRLTTTNPEIESVQLGAQETVRWKASDGLEIEGVLVKPLGFVAGRRYPLVVQVHGGPESCVRNGWVTSWGNLGQLLARDGYAVLYPNYRGSIGRSETFERADHGDLMGAEFEDILAGIDALAAQAMVDADRVGVAGGSYGGYTTAWAATAHSRRFRAGVNFAGISNWLSMQGTSDIPEENALVHWNRPFYTNMNLYWERSPLSHVDECRTPLLILHGEKDARVPVGQGQELYTALRLLGRDVEFVRYPREEHGLKEAPHQLDALNRSLAWFDRWLKAAPGSVTRR